MVSNRSVKSNTPSDCLMQKGSDINVSTGISTSLTRS